MPEQVSPQELDFGAVRLHDVSENTITVVNQERKPLTIAQVAMQGGDGAFSHSFEAPITVAPSSTAKIAVRFKPTSAGVYAATMTLSVQGAGFKVPQFTLKGIGLNKDCFLAPEAGLDFGRVSVTASLVREVRIRNESDLPWDVEVGGITSEADSEAFALLNFGPGRHTIAARSELAVPVIFRPMRLGVHEAVFSIFESPMCPTTVRLTGVAVGEALQCEPQEVVDGLRVCRVNFGAVLPLSKTSAEIVLRNVGDVDLKVTLRESALEQPPGKGAPFAVETAEREFTVPVGGARVVVPVSFGPTERGAQQGSLTFDAPGTSAGSVRVELYGEGGGPEIQVTPDSMSFGEVTVDAWLWRKLTIANVGIDVERADTALRIGRLSDDGQMIEPGVEVVSDTPDEFTFEWPKAHPAPGIAAIAGKKSVEMRVKFSPKTLGDKQAVLRIYSNDPVHPVVEVPVHGRGSEGTCEYVVRPESISFGLVDPSKFVVASFYIVNTSPFPKNTCFVSSLDLAPGSPDTWVLLNGPVTDYSIPGGEALEVSVRFQPMTADASYPGAIEFTISNAAQPNGRIELSGGGGAKNCLLVSPGEIDFGVVGAGCGFSEQMVSVYNVCTTDVTIEDLGVQAASSAAFTLSQMSPMPATIASGAGLSFKVSYRPASVGQDSGTVSFRSAQHAGVYVLSLTGRGATQAAQTDVFVQEPLPKLDVLLVVDDSSAMSGLQASLARNLASFMTFLNHFPVDYHLAVTTTSVNQAHGNTVTDGINYNGLFAPLDRSDPTVLTATTPNVEQVFGQNVAVGTDGNSRPMLIRPAYLALSPPQILGPSNAGFLRDEAGLAIIVISNAEDQDAVPVDFYQNFIVGLKGARRSHLVSFAAVIPTLDDPPAGCSYGNPGAGRSSRVKSLVAATGGVVDEICSSDWATTLKKLGTTYATRSRFSLSAQPDLAFPLVVTVDGRDIPPKDANGAVHWSYNRVANCIDFDELTTPPPGATFQVGYRVNCRP